METPPAAFGALAVSEGLISRRQLEGVLNVQQVEPDRRIGQLLVAARALSPADVLRLLEAQGKALVVCEHCATQMNVSPRDRRWTCRCGGEVREVQPDAPSLSASFDLDARGAGAADQTRSTTTRQERIAGRLGRFDVLRPLGSGGMAEVFEVHDEQLERTLAAKVCNHSGDQAAAMFESEALISGQLEHPGIVPVHERGLAADGRPYMVMKRVRGIDLELLLFEMVKAERAGTRRQPRHPAQGELLRVFLKICETMAYAHDQGVLHRDLKPSNVMLGPFGEVHVMDWGLALRHGRNAIGALPTHAVGTPEFMAPEQARAAHDEMDERTDVYALGLILYQMLALRTPFDDDSDPGLVMQAVLAGELEAPSQRAETRSVPWELEQVVLRATSYERADRYQTVGALSAEVERYLEGRPLAAAQYSLVHRLGKWFRRHPVVAVLAFVALCLAIGGPLTLDMQRKRTEAQMRQKAIDAAVARAEARLAAVGALPDVPTGRETGAQRKALALALARSLDAVAQFDRALALAGWDRALRERRRVAGERLANVALAAGDYTLARHAIAALGHFDVDRREVRRRLAELDSKRDAERDRRSARIKEIVAALRAGPVDDSEGLVFELVGYRDLQTISLLAAELRVLGEKREWAHGDREVGKLACRVLGRIGLGEAVPPLVRALAAVRDTEMTVEIGRAMCFTRRPEVYQPLVDAMVRLGINSATWHRIAAAFRGVPEPVRMAGQGGAFHFSRGLVRMIQVRKPEALADFDRAIELMPGHVAARANRGLVLLGMAQYRRAIADFSWVIERQPQVPSHHSNRGFARLLANDLDAALVDLDRALALDVTLHTAHNNRAQVLLQLGRAREALVSSDRAVQLAPGQADCLVNRARIKAKLGDASGAMRDLGRGIQLAPRAPRAYYDRALIHVRAGRTNEALADLDRAIQYGPRVPMPYFQRAVLLRKQGKLREAEATYDRVLRVHPDHPTALCDRGMVRRMRKNLTGARDDLRRAVALQPKSWAAWGNLGLTLRDMGQRDKAIEALEKARSLAPPAQAQSMARMIRELRK